MSATSLKLATIAYLSLAKSESDKVSWSDVSRSMIFFEENKNRPLFGQLLKDLCKEDPKYDELDVDDKPAHCSEKLFKITQLFRGRIRNLANVNGQIVVQRKASKKIEVENSDKNGKGKQAFLMVRMSPAGAKDHDVWEDIIKKTKDNFKHNGGCFCPDMLWGVVWDSDEETLQLTDIAALEKWCLEKIQKSKKVPGDASQRVKSYLQEIIAYFLATLDPKDIQNADLQEKHTPSQLLTNQEYSTFKILHGPPGTGKTTLAKSICLKNGWKPYIVQIHPSYSYEEFIEGLKPITFANGELRYDVVDGPVKILSHIIGRTPVYALCAISKAGEDLVVRLPLGFAERYAMKQVFLWGENSTSEKYYEISGDSLLIKSKEIPNWAAGLSEADAKLTTDQSVKEIFQKVPLISANSDSEEFCLILDEINRGNVSQLLGELLFSISETESEDPKPVKLQYSQQAFSWPKGLHVIGTMNTADLSTDRMDQAVKRRFSFEYIEPQPSIYENGEEFFDFLRDFNAKSLERDANFKKIESLNAIALQFGRSKFSFTQLLSNLNQLLIRSSKKYGLINVGDKLIGHSFFIKMARRVCSHFEAPNVLELAFYGEFKEMLLGEILPALQSIFNYDAESLNLFFSEWSGKQIVELPGTEKWADDVMVNLLWQGENSTSKSISLEKYRQRQWTKSA